MGRTPLICQALAPGLKLLRFTRIKTDFHRIPASYRTDCFYKLHSTVYSIELCNVVSIV